MLPGIICTIKIGKLCRCYCLSGGINACILIFSAAGSCWIPSGWFSHPPGTPVTASAHTEICKTFFSWCQPHYSGKVRALYWITSSTKCDPFPSGIPAHSERNGTFGWVKYNILSDLSIPCCHSLVATVMWSAPLTCSHHSLESQRTSEVRMYPESTLHAKALQLNLCI